MKKFFKNMYLMFKIIYELNKYDEPKHLGLFVTIIIISVISIIAAIAITANKILTPIGIIFQIIGFSTIIFHANAFIYYIVKLIKEKLPEMREQDEKNI